MLPILQAPADDYNSMATVINRFVSISQHFDQKYIVITADQPLYSRETSLHEQMKKIMGTLFFE